MPALLGSLLKGENLAIVESDVAGWKRIVDIGDIVPLASAGQASEILERDGPAAAVTQVIPIKNADITKLAQSLRPFLSKGANFLSLPENRLIIVTDYAQNVKTMAEILRLIDEPTGRAIIQFYDAKNRTPASLIEQVEALISEERGRTAGPSNAEVKLFNDASGKRVVVAVTKQTVASQQMLRCSSNSIRGWTSITRVYRLQNVSAESHRQTIREVWSADEESKRRSKRPSTRKATC